MWDDNDNYLLVVNKIKKGSEIVLLYIIDCKNQKKINNYKLKDL